MLISFDGLECTNDLVFYIMYKYFKNSDLWCKLKTVTLDACRYVTDFGVEILYEAVGRTALLDRRTSTGCKKLLKYLHLYEEKHKNEKDLFLLPSFSKLNEQEETNAINTCKVLVLNDTNFRFVKYVQEKIFQKAKSTVDYFEFKFYMSKHVKDGGILEAFKLNLVEIDSVSY